VVLVAVGAIVHSPELYAAQSRTRVTRPSLSDLNDECRKIEKDRQATERLDVLWKPTRIGYWGLCQDALLTLHVMVFA